MIHTIVSFISGYALISFAAGWLLIEILAFIHYAYESGYCRGWNSCVDLAVCNAYEKEFEE